MQHVSAKLLSDTLSAADSILRAISGKTLAEYRQDELLRAGVERWFEKIGESLRRLERKDPDTAARIPELRNIIDFRNLLAHGYDVIEDDQVWHYANTYLPELRATVASLLQGIEPGRSDSTQMDT
jgi:uncharacterized protein with HEPN domain